MEVIPYHPVPQVPIAEGKEHMDSRMGCEELLLDQFVFRCDYGATRRFPENETTAASSTCIGVPFRVCLDVAAPPAISRFYLEWPRGPRPEAGKTSDIVAMHRGCILFRLTSVVRSKTSPQHLVYPDDYFVYIPGHGNAYGPMSGPSLTRLPTWIRPIPDPVPSPVRQEEKEIERETWPESYPEDTAEIMAPTKEMLWVERLLKQKHEEEMALGVDVEEEVVRSSLVVENVGLVCRRDNEYVVSQLQLCVSSHEAELCVLRSCASASAQWGWDLMRVPVVYDKRRGGSKDVQSFSPQSMVPFGDRLCWVDYCHGMVLANVLEHNPVVYYLPFPPPVAPSWREYMHRAVCATDGGRSLKLIDVEVNVGTPPRNDNAFIIWTYTLRMMEDGNMKWDKDGVSLMTAEELWGLKAPVPIPHEVAKFPLVSINKPQVLRFLVSECTDYVDTVTLITVDLSTRTVMSVSPYTKGEQELNGEDADLVQAKSNLLQSFLPAECSNALMHRRSLPMSSVLVCLGTRP